MASPKTCMRNTRSGYVPSFCEGPVNTRSGYVPSFCEGPVNTRSGFTLIELVVVLALIAMVSGFGLIVSMENYRGYSFHNERDTLVTLLTKARSQAVSNMCFGASCTNGRPHGLHLEPHHYTLFQGDSYATRDTAVDEVLDARYEGVSAVVPSFTDIVFAQLSGKAVANPLGVATITLIDSAGKDTSTISINTEGQISWTN